MRIYVLLILILPFCAFAQDFNLDCGSKSSGVEQIICTTPELLEKHNALSLLYSIQKTTYKKRYAREPSSSIKWIQKRDLCEDYDCLDATYSSQIYKISESTYYMASYPDCGATTRCALEERFYIGLYQGRQVIVDKVKKTECFKGCSAPWREFYVYEIANGKRDKSTEWHGKFKNIYTKLDPQYKRNQINADSRSAAVNRVIFGNDKPGCPDCYERTSQIVRTENGWERSPID